MKTDTIAAISTAMSDSGIGIIRISGDEAIEVVDKIYRTKSGKKNIKNVSSHTINYGFIYDSNHQILDEVMVSVMKAPRSYTTEDTIEINCHGGILIMNRILEEVVKAGARVAEPGEFTKRAFLNGRIDLSKAEAIMDIINSKNQFALNNSIKQLRGSVSDMIRELRDEIIYEIAFIESALDDPEHISLDGYQELLTVKTKDIIVRLKKLLDSSDNGKVLKEGINTVIVGKPNAGKSSLLNLIIGEEKAIVTHIAGTTRDVLEETIKFNGINLNIIDTAGIRSTEDVVEKIGVEKAKKYALDADLIIYVVDASVPLDESDYDIIRMIQNKKCIILLNKADLENVITEEYLVDKINQIFDNEILSDPLTYNNMIKISTKDNIGIEQFEEMVKNMFFHGEISYNDEIFITNMRHKEAIMDAYDSMLQVEESLMNDMPEDFYSIDLMSAYSSLGSIIGEEVEEDLVNEIFSKFCMGK